MMAQIRIGTRMPFDGLLDNPSPLLFTDDAELKRHVGTPWMSDFLAERHSIQSSLPPTSALRPFFAEEEELRMHALLIGASGSGKTRLALHLLREQLRMGRSAVFMDIKEDTVRQAIQCAKDAGFTESQVTVLWPQERTGGMPEWNLLAGEPEEAVSLFMDSMKSVFSDSWGYRLSNLLRLTAAIAAYCRLSLREVVELLRNQEYAQGMLREAKAIVSEDIYRKYFDAFALDYVQHSASTRKEYSNPVLNKMHSFVTQQWMESLFCAQGDTLKLSELWQRPRLVAIHLDQVSLGSEAVSLLATMMASFLYAISLRKPGDVPVVLMLDELDVHERHIGKSLLDIIKRSRQQGLRLITATQTLSSVSGQLVAELLGNTYLRAFFNMGSADADIVARSLVTGNGTRVLRAELTPKKEAGFLVETERTYPILRSDGQGIAITPEAWQEAMKSPRPHAAITLLLRMSRIWDAKVGHFPLQKALRFVPDEWSVFEGPAPLKLRVRFPRPNVTILDSISESEQAAALSKLIQALPERHAIVRLRDGTTGLVHIQHTKFTKPYPNPRDWMQNGQAMGTPEQLAHARGEAIHALANLPETPIEVKPPVTKPARRVKKQDSIPPDQRAPEDDL